MSPVVYSLRRVLSTIRCTARATGRRAPTHPTRLLACCLLLVAAGGCKSSTATQISQSFRNPGFEDTVFEKLLVMSVGKDQEQRIAFEDAFAAAIVRQRGVAEASWTLLPESTLLSEEEIYGAVKGGDFDGILVTRLLSVEQNRSYTPPRRYHRPRTTFYAAGPAWGMGFGGYYGFYATTFTEVHKPGYFETSKTFRLETNLYSAATNDLVWTAQSETIDPKSVDDLLGSMTSTVAERLRSEGFIP